MCHHICPVGNATGQERNTARARALALSLVNRDALEFSDDIINNLYECTLCGGCTNDCVTGWDPIVFIKEARTEAAMNGKSPKYITKMIDALEATGNVYGIKKLDSELSKEISLLPKSNTLLFLGMDARTKVPSAAINAIKALKKSGVEFTALADEPNSGWAMDTLVGATEETRQTMLKAASVINNYKTVIVFDPSDAKSFIHEYKEWGIKIKAEVKTFTAVCAKALADGKLKLAKSNTIYTFQDPALLVREVGESEEPRQIIEACGELKEMFLNRKGTMFAGNLLMTEYLEDTMKLIAAKRWEDASRTGANVLVTACCSEYAVLNMVKPENMELKTIEQIIVEA